jgi:uncharacterized HAD superfamily protein
MKLGFDIDGVVADMPRMMVDYLNETFDLNHDLSILVSHDVSSNRYVEDDDFNDEIATRLLEDIVRNGEILIDIDPYDDAVEAIRKLSKAGHSIHFITARPSDQRNISIDWLRKNHIPFDTCHSIGKNTPGGGFVNKGRLARTLNLDFFLDDSLWHLENMYKYKNRWRKGVALLSRPWNVHELLDPSRFIRFNDWDEIIRHLGIHKR